MVLQIRHAILEVTNPPTTTKQSAIIINNEIIISSACILQSYVRPTASYEAEEDSQRICPSTKIIRSLQRGQLINTQDANTVEAQHLNNLSYQVSFDPHQSSKAVAKKRPPYVLTRYRVRLLYVFNSPDISRNLHTFFNQSSPAEMLHNEVLLSSFVVLTLNQTSQQDSEGLKRFLTLVEKYLRYLEPVHTLDDVLTMCTPFGLENFYKTISIGKVSNVLGRNGCLFVVSNALPTGCEGSAVFNSKLRLIGIIICTTFQRRQENVNLTMAANFSLILHDLAQQLGMRLTSTTLQRQPSKFNWERSIVAIEAAGSQGTGTFITVQNKRFILTCSHVVFKAHSEVNCRSSNGDFKSEILWSNPHYDKAFDIAILTAPANTPHRSCVRLSTAKPSTGKTVYNAGFPYLVNFHLKYDFNPSIFQGRIIRCTPGAIMSDGCVQAGQSGGPMFDDNGCILGVCVSNIKMDKVVYPNINTAVPVSEIRSTLESYAKSNDVTILNNLVASKEIQRAWSMETTPIILSKL